MTVVASNKIWLEGNAAKAAGQPSTANPYPAGSQESADWLEGYTTAELQESLDGPASGEA
jgi:hypothetical protein